MAVIIIISLLAFLFTILDSRKLLRGGMALGFTLITLVSIIRYDYGNDYMGYYSDFDNFCKYDIEDIITFNGYFKDSGWAIFCKLFEPLGFFAFVAFLSLSCNVIYYKFIKENVSRQDYWIAMFIYLFTFDIFALQLSMIRQGFVIALFVLSYHYLKKQQLLIPLVLMMLSISLHKSAIVIVPFLLLSKYPFKTLGKYTSVVILITFVLLFISSGMISQLLEGVLALEALSTYNSDYALEDGNEFGVRAMLEFIPFFISLYYLGSNKTFNGPRYLVFLSTISALISPFTTIIHLISRISFYFTVFTIATVPLTYRNVGNKYVRIMLLSLFLAITLYVYFDRFNNSVYTKYYAKFDTIFSIL